jgi:cytochrome c oxidase subunit 2
VTQALAGSLDPQGPVAEAMADLWWLMLGLGVAVFAVFAALLVVGLFRRGSATESEPSGQTRNLVRRWIVGGGVVMPVVVLTVVFGATVSAMRFVPSTAPPEALVVEVVGHMFWWEVHYPEQGVTTANELRIPVGRPINLQLTSADVIHSFWVPALGGKIDMLPDGVNTLVLQADEPGEHVNRCAEFCGIQHANMAMLVIAQEPEEFERWLAEQAEPAAEPQDADVRAGQEIFLSSSCVYCHTVRGHGTASGVGPDLTHLASRRTIGAGVAPNARGHLGGWIVDPQAMKPGNRMPGTNIAGEDLQRLLDYLESLE